MTPEELLDKALDLYSRSVALLEGDPTPQQMKRAMSLAVECHQVLTEARDTIILLPAGHPLRIRLVDLARDLKENAFRLR